MRAVLHKAQNIDVPVKFTLMYKMKDWSKTTDRSVTQFSSEK